MIGYRFQMGAPSTWRVSSRLKAAVPALPACSAGTYRRSALACCPAISSYAGDSCSMPTRVIDIHPHIIATDTNRYPLAPLGGHQSEWSRTRPVTTEQMLDAMDEAGVGKSAIVQASTCYGHDNSYVAAAVAAHPERFTGVFSVDVLAPDASERIRHWVGR